MRTHSNQSLLIIWRVVTQRYEKCASPAFLQKNGDATQGQGPESDSKTKGPKPINPPPEFSTCHTPTTLSHAHFSACITSAFFIIYKLQLTTHARVVPRTLSLSSFRKEKHQKLAPATSPISGHLRSDQFNPIFIWYLIFHHRFSSFRYYLGFLSCFWFWWLMELDMCWSVIEQE